MTKFSVPLTKHGEKSPIRSVALLRKLVRSVSVHVCQLVLARGRTGRLCGTPFSYRVHKILHAPKATHQTMGDISAVIFYKFVNLSFMCSFSVLPATTGKVSCFKLERYMYLLTKTIRHIRTRRKPDRIALANPKNKIQVVSILAFDLWHKTCYKISTTSFPVCETYTQHKYP